MTADIEKLEQRIAHLESLLAKHAAWPCPVCGGETSSSTRYPKRYCLQRLGHCGEWVLPEVGRKKSRPADTGTWPQTYFSRTTIDADGRVLRQAYVYDVICRLFFKAGKQVSEEEYLEGCEVVTK